VVSFVINNEPIFFFFLYLGLLGLVHVYRVEK